MATAQVLPFLLLWNPSSLLLYWLHRYLVHSACMQCNVWSQHQPGKLVEPLETRLIQDLGVSLSLVIEAPEHSMVRTIRQVQSMVVQP